MKTRRIMRAAAIVRGSLLICALLVGLPGSGVTPSAWAQMPDNRGVKLNPEDSVPPAYRGTLDERDRLRLDAARRQGQSFVPVVQGQGRVQGYTAPANPLGAEPGQPANEPPPLLGRPGGGRAAPRPTYEAYSPSPTPRRATRSPAASSTVPNPLLRLPSMSSASFFTDRRTCRLCPVVRIRSGPPGR